MPKEDEKLYYRVSQRLCRQGLTGPKVAAAEPLYAAARELPKRGARVPLPANAAAVELLAIGRRHLNRGEEDWARMTATNAQAEVDPRHTLCEYLIYIRTQELKRDSGDYWGPGVAERLLAQADHVIRLWAAIRKKFPAANLGLANALKDRAHIHCSNALICGEYTDDQTYFYKQKTLALRDLRLVSQLLTEEQVNNLRREDCADLRQLVSAGFGYKQVRVGDDLQDMSTLLEGWQRMHRDCPDSLIARLHLARADVRYHLALGEKRKSREACDRAMQYYADLGAEFPMLRASLVFEFARVLLAERHVAAARRILEQHFEFLTKSAQAFCLTRFKRLWPEEEGFAMPPLPTPKVYGLGNCSSNLSGSQFDTLLLAPFTGRK